MRAGDCVVDGGPNVSGDTAPTVVLRGGSEADAVEDAVEDAGGVVAARVSADESPSVADSDADDVDAVFAVGEAALLSAFDGETAVPVLPVAAGYGRYSLRSEDAGRAVDALRAGETRTVRHDAVTVRVGDETVGRAVTDVTLMTSEPARISEYSVADDVEEIDSFRADGVVAATPLGSAGYARAVGGPVLAPGTGLAVAPVAPYATDADSWVLEPPVTLSVRRDDAPVSLALDDTVVRRVPPDVAVEIDVGEAFSLLRVPAAAVSTRS